MRLFSIVMMLTAAGLSAQTVARTPEFEAAVIRLAGSEPRRMQIQNDRLDFAGVSLKEIVAQAFHVETYQVRAPHWIERQNYSITAKLPSGATKDQIPPMLQALLVDRLKLKSHHENTEQRCTPCWWRMEALSSTKPRTSPPLRLNRGEVPGRA